MSMAEPLDDGEFWLPSQFLADDELAVEKHFIRPSKLDHEITCTTRAHLNRMLCSEDFRSHYNAVQTSPVSCLTPEPECEEDDYRYLVNLNPKLASAGLNDSSGWSSKDRYPSGSPQSTLCPLGDGCGCVQGTCRCSPNGCTKSSFPQQATWELLYAAAGEVAKMKMNEEALYGLKASPLDSSVGRQLYPSTGDYKENQAKALYYKLQAIPHFRQQLLESQEGYRGRYFRACRSNVLPSMIHSNYVGSRNTLPPVQGVSAPHVQLQFHRRQDLTAGGPVFHSSPISVKKQCAGTGVFLPRRNVVAPLISESRKDGGSTVLLPGRVVQALNLNFDYLRGCPPLPPRARETIPSANSRVRPCDFVVDPLPKISYAAGAKFASEVRLPQEWTY